MNLLSFITTTLCLQALVCYTDKPRANKQICSAEHSVRDR